MGIYNSSNGRAIDHRVKRIDTSELWIVPYAELHDSAYDIVPYIIRVRVYF